MEEFKDGKYGFYTRNELVGELIIKDNSISYASESDEHSIGDIFPEGEINLHTKGQLHKYLHGDHPYSHLQLEEPSSQ